MNRKKYDTSYYHRHKEQCSKLVKEWQKKNPERYLWLSAKNRAKRDGRDFDITPEDIVIPELCPVFGLPMEGPSLDRFDSSKGYVKGNVRVISRKANRLKSDATVEDLEALLRYMKGL